MDQFPDVPGAPGTALPERVPQMKVLKDKVFTGAKGDAMKVFLHLYPSVDIKDHVRLIWAEMKKRGCNHELTVGEYLVFIGLLNAAVLRKECGRALWDKSQEDRLFRDHPEFSRFMTRKRFEDIKSCASYAITDESQKGLDPWYRARSGFDGLNANRQRTVRISEVLTPDETMSPMCPRTTKHGAGEGALPHYSFVPRKPEPHGTEFKTVCDGRHGLMLYMEIQEGAKPMAKKRFRDTLGGNSACGVRLALGASGLM